MSAVGKGDWKRGHPIIPLIPKKDEDDKDTTEAGAEDVLLHNHLWGLCLQALVVRVGMPLTVTRSLFSISKEEP